MPKMKTHSGAKKRFRVTGSGKIMHERAGKRHLLERKSSRLTRRLTGDVMHLMIVKIKKVIFVDFGFSVLMQQRGQTE